MLRALTLSVAVLLWGVTPALAQSEFLAVEIDAEARESAEALVGLARERARARADELRGLFEIESAPERAARVEGYGVEEYRVEDLEALATVEGAEHELRIFVTLGMPDHMLSQYLADAERFGGVLVISGLLDGSMKTTLAAVQAHVEANGGMGGMVIDPKAFETFSVSAVPTIVLSEGEVGQCLSPDCELDTPLHDRLTGAVSVEHALRRFAEEGDMGETATRILDASG